MHMGTTHNDLRLAVRSLLRRPVFTAVAALTLALGVGASTAMFSVFHGIVLQPLRYPAPERVVRLFPTVREGTPAPWTGADFVDFARQASSYEAVAGFQYVDYSVAAGGAPRLVVGASVTSAFFQVLAVPPLHGRLLGPATDPPGGARVVVLGFDAWQSQFGADPSIVGRTIELAGEGFTVVGVMPPGFSCPAGARLWTASRFRAPERADAGLDPGEDRGDRYFNVIGRLRVGVTMDQAREEGKAINARLASAFPETNRGQGFGLNPLHEDVVASVRPMLAALLAAAGLVLLVACANVANVLLASAAGRTREVAVRTALGAGRLRIARQLLCESVVLGLVGGTLGIGVAAAGTRGLLASIASDLPRAAEVSLSLPVLGFALAASLLSGIGFGVAPVLWLTRGDPAGALREAGGRTILGRAHGRARAALVAAEMAISLALLVGAGLLVRTLGELGSVDPGFSERNALTAQVWLPGTRAIGDDELRVFHTSLLEKIRALPGVTSAGAVLSLPVDDAISAREGYSIEGRVGERGNEPVAGLQIASPGYFESLGIPVLRGRSFTDEDGPQAPPVMIVSQAFADRFFPGEDPVGKRMGAGHPESPGFGWATIVGVVGSTRHAGLDSGPKAEAYTPLAQSPTPWISLVVRASVPAGSLAEPLRQAVMELDPRQPVARIQTVADILHDSLARRRLHLWLLGLFALMTLGLAAVGQFGVMSFAVSQRTPEIGLRVALGAGSRDVIRLVASQAAGPLLGGLVLGTCGAFLVGWLMRSFLFGVGAADPLSLVAGAVVLTAAAAVASLLPTVRALRTDPIASLRSD